MKKNWNKELPSLAERECVEYFREHPVFDRVLKGFRDKYASYGSFAGTVILTNLSEEEREDLEVFFQKNFHGQKSVSISAVRFGKALKESRFGCFEPKEVLELYFQEKMTGKKEQKKEEERKRQEIFVEVRKQCAGTWAGQWMDELEQPDSEMHRDLLNRCRESWNGMEEMKRLLVLGIKILNGLPYRQETAEYLAVFASMMTGNPHAFDDGTKDGKFLNLLVQWDIRQRKIMVEKSHLFPALQRQRFYLAAGILRDDISNYVMVSGIRAWKKNGQIHAGMEGFQKDGDPVQVSLSVIAGWKRVECPADEIYIVENPSVFAMLCGKWRGRKACMCMNGQPRLSALLLLDLLAQAGVRLYYAGDFDPEGLLIAQKVKQYYKGRAVYWHMSLREYEKSRSQEIISSKRMKMLERIEDTELSALAAAIRTYGTAGYQENIWELLS